MSLPKIDVPRYTLIQPSTKKSIQYRPFLVKEQKALLIANEMGDNDQMLSAIRQIILDCTFGKVDPFTAPLFDLEYIFTRIRAKSVGENVDCTVNCINQECKKPNDISINLETIEVKTEKGHTTNILLSQDIGVIMRYPTAELERTLLSREENKRDYDFIIDCIESVYDKDSVYPTKDEPRSEIEAFVEGLNTEQFEKIVNFFYTLPTLSHDVEFDCVHCKTHNKVELRGLDSFFGF